MERPRKHWLLSRKLWLAFLTTLTLFLRDRIGLDLDPEMIIAIVLPVVAYILGESYVDSQH